MIRPSKNISLLDFINESNAIEGIYHFNEEKEYEVYKTFLELESIIVADVCNFVYAIGGGKLRSSLGDNVIIGNHVPPRGGILITKELESILNFINEDHWTPYKAHLEYETLHPFMDGNGRSGRVLWLWHMLKRNENPWFMPFLQRFYYQTLDHSPGR